MKTLHWEIARTVAVRRCENNKECSPKCSPSCKTLKTVLPSAEMTSAVPLHRKYMQFPSSPAWVIIEPNCGRRSARNVEKMNGPAEKERGARRDAIFCRISGEKVLKKGMVSTNFWTPCLRMLTANSGKSSKTI